MLGSGQCGHMDAVNVGVCARVRVNVSVHDYENARENENEQMFRLAQARRHYR